MDHKIYYRVLSAWRKTSDHLARGYEFERDYKKALRQMCERFGGRVGEKLDARSDFLLLRFNDTPDERPEEAWLPKFLLQKTAVAPSFSKTSNEEALLDRIFSFD